MKQNNFFYAVERFQSGIHGWLIGVVLSTDMHIIIKIVTLSLLILLVISRFYNLEVKYYDKGGKKHDKQ